MQNYVLYLGKVFCTYMCARSLQCMSHCYKLSSGLKLEQHDSVLLCEFVQSWSEKSCQICLTLYVPLIQHGDTPLYCASKKDNEELVVLLLDHKADINKVHV